MQGDKPQLQRKQTEVHFVESEGRELWAKAFGLENNLVEWNKFVKGLSDYLHTTISLRDEMNLKKIMDTTHIGLVSPFKFAQFLKGFGPLASCVTYVRLLPPSPLLASADPSPFPFR